MWIFQNTLYGIMKIGKKDKEVVVSGTSCDLMDQQTLTAPEEVSEFQNSNTFDLFWKDLLADPNQPQLTPINVDQPQLTPINLDQPQLTPINLDQPQLTPDRKSV